MKSLNRDKLPLRVRLLAWLNIGVQATFPLAAAFTPSVAGAGSDGRFLQDTAQTQLRTRAYSAATALRRWTKSGKTAAMSSRRTSLSISGLQRITVWQN